MEQTVHDQARQALEDKLRDIEGAIYMARMHTSDWHDKDSFLLTTRLDILKAQKMMKELDELVNTAQSTFKTWYDDELKKYE